MAVVLVLRKIFHPSLLLSAPVLQKLNVLAWLPGPLLRGRIGHFQKGRVSRGRAGQLASLILRALCDAQDGPPRCEVCLGSGEPQRESQETRSLLGLFPRSSLVNDTSSLVSSESRPLVLSVPLAGCASNKPDPTRPALSSTTGSGAPLRPLQPKVRSSSGWCCQLSWHAYQWHLLWSSL